MAAPSWDVKMSHDGSSWTTISSYVAGGGNGGGITFQRGRSRSLDEWVPGTFSCNVRNRTRNVDPTNDEAGTFQPRAGDWLRVSIAGGTDFTGFLESAVANYYKAGTIPDSLLTLTGLDGLGQLNYGPPTAAPASSDLSSTLLDDFLTITAETGLVTVSNAAYGSTMLGWAQRVTRTEGGAARLFSLKNGGLGFMARNHRPDNVLAVGGSGEPGIFDIRVDYLNVEWANSLLLTAEAHTDTHTSASSVATGTGFKSFTVAAGLDFSTGAQVYCYSAADPGDTMTGWVVGYSGTALWLAITSITGSGTNADWYIEHTESPGVGVETAVSASSVATGTGTKTFTVTLGYDIAPGDDVFCQSAGDLGDTMVGTVLSYVGTTLIVDIDAITGSGTNLDWNITHKITRAAITDDQAVDAQDRTRLATLSTMHATNVAAATEALIRCAERAWPDLRVAMVEFELAGLSTDDQNDLLYLDIGDALDVTFDLGSGDPQILRQCRLIDGIRHVIPGNGSHRIQFFLGRYADVDFTVALKQDGSAVAATTNEAVYTMRDGWVDAHISLSATAAGTSDTEVKVTPTGLPAAATNGTRSVGHFCYNDASAVVHTGTVHWDGTDLRMQETGQTQGEYLGMAGGAAVAFAIASGDTLDISLRYRAA